ncbi:MAG: cytochrome c family protein [Myxococcaceae bacterium]|nr:cytochrome c family protein [Myxococcaceae bacterium]
MKPLLALLAAWCVVSCAKKDVRPPQVSTPAPGFTLFVSAGVKGYLGPCGCSENMRGGITRAAAQVALAKAFGHPVLYFDAGDTLFGQAQLPAEAVPQQERKARTLTEAMKAMGLSAKANGPLDDAQGAAFRASLALPELPDNQPRTFEAGGFPLTVVSGPWSPSLVEAVSKARASGAAWVLVLLQEDWRTALRNVDDSLEADAVVVARPGEGAAAEENRMLRRKVPLFSLQDKGRSLLRLDVHPQSDGRFELLAAGAETERELKGLDQRVELLKAQVNEPMLAPELLALRKAKLEEIIARREALAATPAQWPAGKNTFTARFVPLESSLPTDPAIDALVTAYDKDVGAMNVAWAKTHSPLCPPSVDAMPRYVGNTQCQQCHADAFKVWGESKHAAAYATLENKGKNFHLDCVGCHVVGFKKPGGVCRIDEVAGRDHVGCESCHGPGSRHAEDTDDSSIAKGDDAHTCQKCHDQENSPHFNFKEYLAKIIGPGHGQPTNATKK